MHTCEAFYSPLDSELSISKHPEKYWLFELVNSKSIHWIIKILEITFPFQFHFLIYSNIRHLLWCVVTSWKSGKSSSPFLQTICCGGRRIPIAHAVSVSSICAWMRRVACSKMLQIYSYCTNTNHLYTCKQVFEGSLTSESNHIIILLTYSGILPKDFIVWSVLIVPIFSCKSKLRPLKSCTSKIHLIIWNNLGYEYVWNHLLPIS